MLFHTKDDHRYSLLANPSYSLTSVTALVKSKKKSNNDKYWDYWLTYKTVEALLPDFARKKPFKQPPIDWLLDQAKAFPLDLFESTKANIKLQWNTKGEQKAEEGTLKHKEREDAAFMAGQVRSPFDMQMYPVHTIVEETTTSKKLLIDSYQNLKPGLYPEMMITWKDFAGTADQVFISEGPRQHYIDILDFKFKGKFTIDNQFANFKAPWAHLSESSLNEAALQISFYAYFLEQYGYKFRFGVVKVNNRSLPIKYLKKEIEAFFEDFYSPVISLDTHLDEEARL